MLPHIRLPLMQHKLTTQDEALEMAMKLEASPLAETSAGMTNLQNQLANLTYSCMKLRKERRLSMKFGALSVKHRDTLRRTALSLLIISPVELLTR